MQFHHHHHFWQAPLGVRSAERRHRSPEWVEMMETSSLLGSKRFPWSLATHMQNRWMASPLLVPGIALMTAACQVWNRSSFSWTELPEETKRAPSAPVWNQSFPSPRHCWSAAPSTMQFALFKILQHKHSLGQMPSLKPLVHYVGKNANLVQFY